MSTQADFTLDEWRQLQYTPIWTFVAVAGVDCEIHHQEVQALARELAEAHLYREPLVREVLTAAGEDLSHLLPEAKIDGESVLDGLERAAEILDGKTAHREAEHFKKAMLLIAKKVAEASGGFLGFGRKVSKEEQLAMPAVARALGLNLS